MALHERFVRHVRERGLLQPGAGVVVACSGGADSTALLHLVDASRDRIGTGPVVAAHLDHGLRPDSPEDLAAVGELAAGLGLPFAGERREVRARDGESPEESARRVRYGFLVEVARDTGAPQVLTAHHMDDQAETVLLRVLRGTGVDGLAAIRERRALAPGVDVVRPLLPFRRAELRAWLAERGLPWREDPTNRDGNDRARLRATGLPALRECLGRDPVPPLARLAANAADADPIAADRIGAAFVEASPRSVHLHPGFERLPRAAVVASLRAAVGALRDGRAPSREELDRLLAAAGGRDAEAVSGLAVELGADGVRILPEERRAAPLEPQRLELPGSVELAARGRLSVEVVAAGNAPFLARLADHARTTELADADSLRTPLTVRAPRAGDRMQPLGWDRPARLGHVLQRRGIPAAARPRLPLLCDAQGIVWAATAALADRVRVRPETARIAVLRLTRD